MYPVFCAKLLLMTARTHDLASFTALGIAIATQPKMELSLATAIISFGAGFIGGLTPDIDEPSAKFWGKLPAGSLLGKLIQPFLGGHRLISHSLLGMGIAGFLLWYLLNAASSVILVHMQLVWWAFMLGYFSHLVMDTLTKEGVPWLFPIPIHFGFPPFEFLRIKTGGLYEKSLVFPGLLILNLYIFYINYGKFIEFLRNINF